MRRNSKNILLIVLILALAGSAWYTFDQYRQLKRIKIQVRHLRSENSDLEEKIAELENEKAQVEDEKEELEEQLDEVEHFDDDGTVSSGHSQYGVSFTGDVMECTIDGDFEGWSGETIFKMTDGSIWQQASYDYTYSYEYSPRAIIYKKSGSFYMRVEGIDDEIMVKRLK